MKFHYISFIYRKYLYSLNIVQDICGHYWLLLFFSVQLKAEKPRNLSPPPIEAPCGTAGNVVVPGYAAYVIPQRLGIWTVIAMRGQFRV